MAVLGRFGDLWKRDRAEIVTVRVGDDYWRLRSARELETRLGPWVPVSAGVRETISGEELPALREMLLRLNDVHQKLMQALVKNPDGTLEQLWRQLNLGELPDDHGWSVLFIGLGAEGVPGEFRRAALGRYLQHLAVRRNVVQDRIKKLDGQAAGLPPLPPGFAALPSDKGCRLRWPSNGEILLLLGRRAITLRRHTRGVAVLVEPNAVQILGTGLHTVGRSRGCSVMVPSDPETTRQVSREHLVIDVDPEGNVWLADSSRNGSYVARHCLVLEEASLKTLPAS